jgi:hypothetical protein
MASLSSSFGSCNSSSSSSSSSLTTTRRVVVVDTDEKLTQCSLGSKSSGLVLALDCEGLSLSRNGQVSLVQLSSPSTCYLFDVTKCSRLSKITLFLKEILEDPNIIKIIHDCRMDSDALFHKLDIKLTGCHDTQAWDFVLRNQRLNLNKTLMHYGCPPNPERDTSIYVNNPAFWLTRPLSRDMIEWAAGDVKSLFDLRNAQKMRVANDTNREKMCISSSNQAVQSPRDFKICRETTIHPTQMKVFIGKGGSNIQALQNQHYFFQTQGRGGKVFVYASDSAYLQIAQMKLIQYQSPYRPTPSRRSKPSRPKFHSRPSPYGYREDEVDDYDAVMLAAGVPQYYLDNCLSD